MSDEISRIFETLRDQNKTLAAQDKLLAKIEQSQEDMCARLFGGAGQAGVLHYFADQLKETNAVVSAQAKQITFWKGGIAVLGVLWTAILAVIGVVFKRQ